MIVGLMGKLTDCGGGTTSSDSIDDIIGFVVPTGVETTASPVDPTGCSTAL